MGLTISVVTTKGGSGKSTLTALLAGEFANQGQAVRILDADPQQTLVKWSERCKKTKLIQPNIEVRSCPEQSLFEKELGTDAAGITLIDVQGAASNFLSMAALASDLVLVPCIASAFDTAEANKVPQFLASKAARKESVPPYRIIMNHVDGIEVKSKTFQNAVVGLADQGLDIMQTIIFRRLYYRQVFEGIGSLYLIRKRDEAVLKAIANIRDLAIEMLDILETGGAAK